MKRRSFLQSLAGITGLIPFISPSKSSAVKPDGLVLSAKEFNEWLATFMVYGSDKKEATCDPVSFNAICNLSGFRGFRTFGSRNGEQLVENERWLMTPYGWLKLRKSDGTIGITVIDPPVRGRSFCHANQSEMQRRSEAFSKSIRYIRL
jgi:hypothetical protein